MRGMLGAAHRLAVPRREGGVAARPTDGRRRGLPDVPLAIIATDELVQRLARRKRWCAGVLHCAEARSERQLCGSAREPGRGQREGKQTHHA